MGPKKKLYLKSVDRVRGRNKWGKRKLPQRYIIKFQSNILKFIIPIIKF